MINLQKRIRKLTSVDSIESFRVGKEIVYLNSYSEVNDVIGMIRNTIHEIHPEAKSEALEYKVAINSNFRLIFEAHIFRRDWCYVSRFRKFYNIQTREFIDEDCFCNRYEIEFAIEIYREGFTNLLDLAENKYKMIVANDFKPRSKTDSFYYGDSFLYVNAERPKSNRPRGRWQDEQ